MRGRIIAAAIAAFFICGPALAHGGGGGYVYVPIFIPGGPAFGLPPAQTGDYGRIHSVAVLSAIGEKLRLQTPGGMFGHDREIDIKDWKMDDLSTSIVRRYLSSRFTVKDTAFDRAGLAAIPNGAWTDSTDDFRKYMSTIPADGIDAFVVIRPDLERNLPIRGILGLGLQTGEQPTEWLTYEIDIIDAHTLLRIAKSFSRAQLRAGTGAQLPGFIMAANRNIGDALAPTDAQLAMLKNDFQFHLENTLVETLRSLQLGIDLPAPATRNLVTIPDAAWPFKNIKTVAIVSAVGDTLDLPWSGTLFKHDVHTMATPDWNLDSEIETELAKSLDKRFAVKTVSFDRAKLASARIKLDASKHPLPIDGLQPSSDVDAYIVVLKDSATIGPHAEAVAGFGVWKLVGFGDSATTDVFGTYAMALVDAHTLKILSVAPGVASPRWPSSKLMRRVDNSVCEKDARTLAPDQQKAVYAKISEIMADSVPETLLRMGLTGMTVEKPQAGDATDAAAQAGAKTSPAPAPTPAPAKRSTR